MKQCNYFLIEQYIARQNYVLLGLHFCTPTVHFWGAKGAPILFSEIGFCMAYVCMYIYIYISVKMAEPWGSLILLSHYSGTCFSGHLSYAVT